MPLPLFQLLADTDHVLLIGKLIKEEPHEKVIDAYTQRFEIAEGHYILTFWHNKLHEVIYQTPMADKRNIDDRNKKLFSHYGDGKLFNEILDNGFGKTYRRTDMERYALWSYVMDFTTVGTMEFHPVKWGR
jgi:hypothetical protein